MSLPSLPDPDEVPLLPPEVVFAVDARLMDITPFAEGLIEWYRRVARNYGSTRARIAMSVLMHDHFTEETKSIWIDSLVLAVGRLAGPVKVLWGIEWGCLAVLTLIVLIVAVLWLRDRKRKGRNR